MKIIVTILTKVRNIKKIRNYIDPLSFTVGAFNNFNCFNRRAILSSVVNNVPRHRRLRGTLSCRLIYIFHTHTYQQIETCLFACKLEGKWGLSESRCQFFTFLYRSYLFVKLRKIITSAKTSFSYFLSVGFHSKWIEMGQKIAIDEPRGVTAYILLLVIISSWF